MITPNEYDVPGKTLPDFPAAQAEDPDRGVNPAPDCYSGQRDPAAGAGNRRLLMSSFVGARRARNPGNLLQITPDVLWEHNNGPPRMLRR